MLNASFVAKVLIICCPELLTYHRLLFFQFSDIESKELKTSSSTNCHSTLPSTLKF